MACNSATLNSAFGKYGLPLRVQGLFGHVYPGVTGSIVASYAEQWLKHLAGNVQAHTHSHTHTSMCVSMGYYRPVTSGSSACFGTPFQTFGELQFSHV